MKNEGKTKRHQIRIQIILVATIIIMTFFSVIPKVCAKTSEDVKIMVSLGDSYSSGEGIEPFYGQDETNIENKVGNPDWIAHRSQNSWPGMLKLNDSTVGKNKDRYWFFCAASGAITNNLYNSQHKLYNKYTGSYKGVFSLAPQLDIFKLVGNDKTDYVTLTLGGNDAGFVDIIKEAAMSCVYLNTSNLADKINSAIQDFDEPGGLGDKLHNAYIEIEKNAGKQAHIIVAGYPQLLDEEGSNTILKIAASYNMLTIAGKVVYGGAAALVNEGVHYFNNAIESVVNDCKALGMNISFVSVEEAFIDHKAYSGKPYINGIMLVQSEDINDNLLASPMNALSAYSIHPNYEGACAYAECVQKRIDEIESESARADIDNKIVTDVLQYSEEIEMNENQENTSEYNADEYAEFKAGYLAAMRYPEGKVEEMTPIDYSTFASNASLHWTVYACDKYNNEDMGAEVIDCGSYYEVKNCLITMPYVIADEIYDKFENGFEFDLMLSDQNGNQDVIHNVVSYKDEMWILSPNGDPNDYDAGYVEIEDDGTKIVRSFTGDFIWEGTIYRGSLYFRKECIVHDSHFKGEETFEDYVTKNHLENDDGIDFQGGKTDYQSIFFHGNVIFDSNTGMITECQEIYQP